MYVTRTNHHINTAFFLTYLVLIQYLYDHTTLILLSSVSILACMMLYYKNVSKIIIRIAAPIFIILVFSIIVSIPHIQERSIYLVGKDFYFSLSPILYLLIGSFIMRFCGDYVYFLKLIFISIIIISIANFLQGLKDPSIFLNISLKTRYELDISNVYACFALLFIFLYVRVQSSHLLIRSPVVIVFLVLFLLFSFLVSFSRVFYLTFIVMLISCVNKNKNNLYYFFWAFIAFVTFVIFGAEFLPAGRGVTEGFLEKSLYSLSEITVREYTELSSINNNWRGYEAFLGLQEYYSGNIFEYIFGQGLGTGVVTPVWIFGGQKLDYLPIFHNGNITILLKFGVFGVILFYCFIFCLIKFGIAWFSFKSNLDDPNIKVAASVLIASSFFILLHTFVAHGIFQAKGPWLILILISGSVEYLSHSVNYAKRHQ